MRIVRLSIAACLLFVAGPACAATVHKCRHADGRVVYQGVECTAGARTLASWEAPRDPVVARPRGSAAARTRTPPAQATRYRRATPRIAAAADPCGAARARRDATERRVGLARTYELLSALQRDVYEACK